MSVWGNERLKKLIKDGFVRDTYEGCVNPASINVRLGNSFARPRPGIVMLGDEMLYDMDWVEDGQAECIKPGEFMLATTMESIDVPMNAAVFVQGRSSIGRIGLAIQNAGFVDPKFHGHITLELKNDSPCDILLLPGYPIAQFVYMDAEDVSEGYSGKYNGQVEATGSRMHLDMMRDIGVRTA